MEHSLRLVPREKRKLTLIEKLIVFSVVMAGGIAGISIWVFVVTAAVWMTKKAMGD